MASNVEEDFDFEYDYEKAAANKAERWTEENWREEMAKHPLFMTEAPEPGQEASPLVEAMTQLKYDPEFNSITELMENYKTDGNENYKHKKYTWAIAAYTEGIRIANKADKMKDKAEADQVRHLLSILYNNRASAHFYLANYRSSAADALRALIIEPANQKAIVRIARCYLQAQKYSKCVDFCQHLLRPVDANIEQEKTESTKLCPPEVRADDQTKVELKSMLTEAQTKAKVAQRNERKAAVQERERVDRKQQLISAISARGIRVFVGVNLFETMLPYGFTPYVRFDEQGDGQQQQQLVWTAKFHYPRYAVYDIVRHFHEATTFLEQLRTMFLEPAEWDEQGLFTMDKVAQLKVAYKRAGNSPGRAETIIPSLQSTLLDVMKAKDFVVQDCILAFYIDPDEKFVKLDR